MSEAIQVREIQKRLVHRVIEEVWDQKKLNTVDELFAADVTLHFDGETTQGRDKLRQLIGVWQIGFPDICHKIEDILHSDDKVTVRWHGEGTHLGMFLGMFPTNRKMHYFGITTFRVSEGKFAEIWLSTNMQRVMETLKVFSRKTYTEHDFCEDFYGPAANIYKWLMKARPVPSCKQKLVDGMREQFSTAPPDNEPKVLIPPELFKKISVHERFLPENIRVRIYSPEAAINRRLPLVIYFHGGGWSVGHPEASDLVTRKLSYVGNCVVVSVDYRLAPEYCYPHGLDDCVAAYKWAREYGQNELGADQSRVAVAGDSAGGNLALALVLRTRDEGQRIPNACISICPLTDFYFEKYASAHKFGCNGLLFDLPFLSFVRANYVEFDQWKHPYISPMYADLKKFCPTFILSAGQDLLIDENKVFVEKLNDAGNQVKHFIHEQMPHVYHYFLGLTKEEDEAYQEMARFLKTVLG